jgi:DNA invertase Pin-like site-specific DNA recombinase
LQHRNQVQPKRNQSGHIMRKFQPSLVDWDEIKQRVLAGEGYTSVAKDYEVSRQAIQKRCNKEEWIANKPRSMAVKRELFKRNQKAQPIATAQPVAVAVQPAQPVVLREDKRAAIIQLLADGVPKTHAAAVAGVSEATLHRWVNEDDKFKSEVRAAESAAVALRVQRHRKSRRKGLASR